MLLIKNGQTQSIAPEQLGQWTGVPYRPHLEFASRSLVCKLLAKSASLRKQEELSRRQLWIGSYFQKELLTHPIPPISIRWIDDRIGWGLFAEKPFKEMEFIAHYSGLVRKRRKSDASNAYGFEYLLAPGHPTSYLIDAQDQGGLSRYVNHSDTPNLSSELATYNDIAHVILYTSRPIQSGEQLCYDYGPDYWKHRTR
jgi:hypothetical protein